MHSFMLHQNKGEHELSEARNVAETPSKNTTQLQTLTTFWTKFHSSFALSKLSGLAELLYMISIRSANAISHEYLSSAVGQILNMDDVRFFYSDLREKGNVCYIPIYWSFLHIYQ